MPERATGDIPREGRAEPRPASQETSLRIGTMNAVGLDGTGDRQMNAVARTLTRSRINTNTLAIAFAALMGLGIVTVAGHVQTTAIHDAAHDARHAAGFPCH